MIFIWVTIAAFLINYCSSQGGFGNNGGFGGGGGGGLGPGQGGGVGFGQGGGFGGNNLGFGGGGFGQGGGFGGNNQGFNGGGFGGNRGFSGNGFGGGGFGGNGFGGNGFGGGGFGGNGGGFGNGFGQGFGGGGGLGGNFGGGFGGGNRGFGGGQGFGNGANQGGFNRGGGFNRPIRSRKSNERENKYPPPATDAPYPADEYGPPSEEYGLPVDSYEKPTYEYGSPSKEYEVPSEGSFSSLSGPRYALKNYYKYELPIFKSAQFKAPISNESQTPVFSIASTELPSQTTESTTTMYFGKEHTEENKNPTHHPINFNLYQPVVIPPINYQPVPQIPINYPNYPLNDPYEYETQISTVRETSPLIYHDQTYREFPEQDKLTFDPLNTLHIQQKNPISEQSYIHPSPLLQVKGPTFEFVRSSTDQFIPINPPNIHDYKQYSNLFNDKLKSNSYDMNDETFHYKNALFS